MMNERRYGSTVTVVGLWLLALVGVACLLLRNGGVVPFVFNDEYSYSLYTRLAPMADAIVPDYLYFLVFGTTHACGSGFIDCVRGLNVVFFVASAPFIYLACRRVADVVPSAWVTLLAMAGPLNSYTVYFMPEASYFFAFWVATWFALGMDERSTAWRWAGLGVFVGLMSMVKPHALFLLPALGVYAAYCHLRMRWQDVARTVVALAALVLSTLATKFLVGYLIVGKIGVTLFGHFYSGVASGTAANLEHFVALGGYSLVSLGNHVLAIVLALGLATVAALALAVNGPWRSDEKTPVHRAAVYTVLVLGSLVAVVSLFTGSLAVSDPNELIRLHQRYYDFALPLLMICAAALVKRGGDSLPTWLRVVLAIALLTALGVIFSQRFHGLRPGVLDGPWFDGLMSSRRWFRIVGYAMSVCAIGWIFAPRIAARGFLYAALPLSTLVAGGMVNSELAQHRQLTLYEHAGRAVREYVPPDELGKVVVVCTDPAEGYRVLFSVDDAAASFAVHPDDVRYDWSKLPQGKRWVLSVGGRGIPEDAVTVARGPGYILFRAP